MNKTIAQLEKELKRAKLERKLEAGSKDKKKLNAIDKRIRELEADLTRRYQERSYNSFLNFTAGMPTATRNKLIDVFQIARPGERKITIRCLEGSL